MRSLSVVEDDKLLQNPLYLIPASQYETVQGLSSYRPEKLLHGAVHVRRFHSSLDQDGTISRLPTIGFGSPS